MREVFNPSQDKEQAAFEAMTYAFGARWFEETDSALGHA